MNVTSGSQTSMESTCSCSFQRCPMFVDPYGSTQTCELSETLRLIVLEFVHMLNLTEKFSFISVLVMLYFLLALLFNILILKHKINPYSLMVHSFFEVGI